MGFGIIINKNYEIQENKKTYVPWKKKKIHQKDKRS